MGARIVERRELRNHGTHPRQPQARKTPREQAAPRRVLPRTWDNRSPQGTARARCASRTLTHIARAAHAASAIDATRDQRPERTSGSLSARLTPDTRRARAPAPSARSHITRQAPPGSTRRRRRRSLVLFTDRRFSNCP